MEVRPTFLTVMIFYAVLTYLVGPGLGWLVTNNLNGAGNGYVVGSVLSLVLWFAYGKSAVGA